MRSGTKHLRIASIIQILLGVGAICMIRFFLGEGDVTIAGVSGEEAFALVMASYASAAFQIFAGLMGLLLAKKKSLFTVILGILLFIPQLLYFMHLDNNIVLILVNIVALAIPYYYLHNAYKNFKEKETK